MRRPSGSIRYISVAVFAYAASCCAYAEVQTAERRPNFILILTDDQGYNNLGCFGSKKMRTPNIDRMATEGIKFTDFYAAAPICTPTRAALMTGCYPPRVGLHTPLHTPDTIGIHPDEITLPELLKEKGYTTACIGKWHLGHHPPFYPTRHGFDTYFGTPLGHCFLANRMKHERSDLFLKDEQIIPFPKLEDLTEVLTQQAVRFIKENRSRPFFLFLAHPMPHWELAASPPFRGKSAGGLYGDTIECIDWSTGQVLQAVKDSGLDQHTIVVFTSDNGPERKCGGSAAPLRGWKHSAYEGGMRVPCVMWAPGRIGPGQVCSEVASVMDFHPTFTRLAGAALPKDRSIDGHDIWPLMTGQQQAKSPYDKFFYHVRYGRLAGVRQGRWKLLRPLKAGAYSQKDVCLYDLEADIGETRNLAAEHPGIVERLTQEMDEFLTWSR